jgi:hypothetical protein
MSTKYLEIDSTYRNRMLWPLPGSFEVVLSKSGQRDAISAEDPVSEATPLLSFTSNRFEANTAATSSITGSVILTTIGTTNSKSVIIFETGVDELQHLENYYRHAVAIHGGTTERARILSYEYMGGNRGKISVDKDLDPSSGDLITIEDPTDFTDTSHIHIFIPGGSNSPENYTTNLLYNESLNESRLIIKYDAEIGTVTLGGTPVVGWLPTHNYSIRKNTPSLVTTAALGSTTTTVVLTTGPAFRGQFLRLPQSVYNNTVIAPQGEIRRIVAYDSGTLTATVTPGFSVAPPTGNVVEILAFSYDNFYPFVYTGSRQNELVTYNIRLNSLVVPNQILSVSEGGKIAFYPYLYVELTTIEGQASNIIYSNNPNAKNMLFRASITDTYNLTDSTFITLKGDDMTQTIKFKTETNFKFKVSLPNGEIFHTVLDEYMSPKQHNPFIQISALFELQRI